MSYFRGINILLCLLLLSACFCSAASNQRLRDETEQCNVRGSDFTDKNKSVNHREHVFRERVAGLSSRKDISKKERASGTITHEVVFAVQQRNIDKLTRILDDISDPKSVNYGNHLTREEVQGLTYDQKSHETVLNYLKDAGAIFVSESVYGEYITAKATINLWERFFKTEFFVFHHIPKNHLNPIKIVRAEEYSVPSDLHEHVASVFHTVQMPMAIWGKPVMRPLPTTNISSIIRANAVTGYTSPALLNTIYKIDSNQGSSQSSQAVFEAIEQYVNEEDLSLFQRQFNLPLQSLAAKIGGHVDNTNTICRSNPDTCTEANMDVQYLMAISQRSPTTNWYTDSNSFANWLFLVANFVNPPLVLSISYGAPENTVSKSEFDAFNVQAIKLNAMGISIVAASGDDGVSSFLARGDLTKCRYSPLFPASSPYVLAVGATQGPESGTAERTCQSNLGGTITSGGGFSTYYPQPMWQSNVVSSYFKSVLSTSKAPVPGYNSAGRGYPDISAQGTNYVVFIGGAPYLVSGTSASAPVVAGMLSLINAARLALGKTSIGWINPTLYTYFRSFTNDITIGKNNCLVESAGPCCTQGFNAATGWDPATGLGSFNFLAFKTLIVSLGGQKYPPIASTSKPTRSPTSYVTRQSTKINKIASGIAVSRNATTLVPPK